MMRHYLIGVGAMTLAAAIVSPFYTCEWDLEFFACAAVIALADYGKRWFKW